MNNRKVFREIYRNASDYPISCDYVISGRFDFYERIGTRGRELIPFAGMVGASINEATIKDDLFIEVKNVKTGNVVLSKSFQENHSDKTSIYNKAYVGYLQPDFMGRIITNIIQAIKNDYIKTTRFVKPVRGKEIKKQDSDTKRQIEILDKLHPDWKSIAHSKDFKEWLRTQPESVKRLAQSNDAYEVSLVLTAYKSRRSDSDISGDDSRDKYEAEPSLLYSQ